MAAIEKICEFSYSSPEPPWLMYGYKRNHIQIKPEYRKLFKGAKAVLIITGKNQYSLDKKDDSYYLDTKSRKGHRIATQIDYCFVVLDEHLQGRVKGCYHNSSFFFGTVKRKLSRMVGYKLPVIDVSNHQVAYDDDILKSLAMREKLIFDPGNSEVFLSNLLIDPKTYSLSICFDNIYLNKQQLKVIKDFLILEKKQITLMSNLYNKDRILRVVKIDDDCYEFQIHQDCLTDNPQSDYISSREAKAFIKRLSLIC